MYKLVLLCALVACVAAKPTLLAYSAPVAVAAPIALPAAVSHTYRHDIVSKPVIAAYAAPAIVAAPVVHTAAVHPVAYAAHSIW